MRFKMFFAILAVAALAAVALGVMPGIAAPSPSATPSASPAPSTSPSGSPLPSSSPSNLEHILLKVDGPTCSGCVDAIQSECKKIPGFVSLVCDIDKGTGDFVVQKGMVTANQLIEAVKKAGFKASKPD